MKKKQLLLETKVDAATEKNTDVWELKWTDIHTFNYN